MKAINEKYRVKGDKVIWIIYILFILISLVEVFSSMGKTVYEKQGGAITPMFFKHFFLLLSGIAICYVSHLINYVKYSRIAKPALYLSFALLIFTLVMGYLSPGNKVASRWIVIPFIGQFQPSEIVKYILIIYTATFLATNKSKIKEKQTCINIVVPILLICGLIFPENFSTAALIGLVCYILLLVGGINRKYLTTGLLLTLVCVGLIVLVASKTKKMRSNTWINRIEEFRNPDRMEINQTNIALMAISTGGVQGKFIGNTELARFLSESHNDFIFAIMLEEGGLWMCLFIVLMYISLLYRMIRIAKNAKGDFGSLLALGIALVFILQAIINMMVATNLMPVTGQTLPFISYGGTSFWFSSFALGIVLNISRKENQKTRQDIILDDADNEASSDEEILEEGDKDSSSQLCVLPSKIFVSWVGIFMTQKLKYNCCYYEKGMITEKYHNDVPIGGKEIKEFISMILNHINLCIFNRKLSRNLAFGVLSVRPASICKERRIR